YPRNRRLLKIFGNFVPNFREQMANDKHYPKGTTKNRRKTSMKQTSMKQTLFGTSPNHMKRKLSKVATALLFTSCFALSPSAQAVSPAPKGGYPGGNTA